MSLAVFTLLLATQARPAALANSGWQIAAISRQPAASMPATIRVDKLAQEDLDQDGDPDLTILDTAFATERDRVWVFDGADDMEATDDWRQATDFSNDTWLFDAGADGNAELALVFRMEEGQQVAYVYADRDGDGRVAYQRIQEGVRVTELKGWTVKAIAHPAWFNVDGSLNYNVTFQVDASLPLTDIQSVDYLASLATNEAVDFEIDEVDTEPDGILDYELIRLIAPSPVDWGLGRTILRVNAGKHRAAEWTDYVFWPYLDRRRPPSNGLNYFDIPPTVVVDWAQGAVTDVGLIGYPIETGWHLNTMSAFEKGTVNYANFEVPMAYYDLAADRDGRPELHIRVAYFGPSDRFFQGGTFPEPVEEVTYSWNQFNEDALVWDYKLGLVGRHPIDTVVSLPDFRLKAIPYQDLPAWVTGHRWDFATFVARESEGYLSSEGLYDWAPLEGDMETAGFYLTGRYEDPPLAVVDHIRPGFRGEYNFEYQAQPWLYFSPIDARLHLLGARAGLWNIDDLPGVPLRRRLTYTDLDQDGVIDQWTYLVNDQPQRRLVRTDRHLICDCEEVVRLVRVDTPAYEFVTLPPNDHPSWQWLTDQLREHAAPLAPADFLAMMNRFEGPAIQFDKATLRDFRLTDAGFRFVLTLRSGFQVRTDTHLDGSIDLTPGAYVVSYNGEQMSLRPLTPPHLIVSTPEVDALTMQPIALEAVRLHAEVLNTGREDVRDVPITFTAVKGDMAISLGPVQVDVLGESVALAAIDWVPPEAGLWQIQAQAAPPAAQGTGPVEGPALMLSVAPTSRPGMQTLFSLGMPAAIGPIGPLFTLWGAAVAAITAWLLLAKARL